MVSFIIGEPWLVQTLILEKFIVKIVVVAVHIAMVLVAAQQDTLAVGINKLANNLKKSFD